MSETPVEALWRPDAGLPEDDLARRPSTRLQLCDLCRAALGRPDVLATSQHVSGSMKLCGGTLKDTECSLRAMYLDYAGTLRKYQQEHSKKKMAWPDYGSEQGILTKVSNKWKGETVLKIRADLSGSPVMSLRVQAYLDDPASKVISSRPFLAKFGSEGALKQKGEWMAECEKSHPDCGNSFTATTALPSRVIDVQSLRLHESSLGEVAQYTALSYCWGCEKVPGALVQANLQALKESIRHEFLPQTIQDAIYVTQNLGFKYIWVDAYCILQDDEEDKQKELARMAQIYSQAYATLSASSAANVHEGFLHKRQPRERGSSDIWPHQYPRLVVPFLLPNREEGEKMLGNAVLQPGHADDFFPRDPIMSRAWTFQERLLSRRVIHFGTHELYWQCNGAQRGCGAFEWTGEFSRPRVLSRKEPIDDIQVRREWRNLVGEYTLRDITHEEDRLVALAALASRFSEAQGGNDAYMAGLWNSSIRRSLLWRPSSFPQGIENCRPSVYVAPSWSWASVKCRGGVFWPSEDALNETDEQGKLYVHLLECATTLKSRDLPFGQVTAGRIRLRGPLRPELQGHSPTICSKEQTGPFDSGSWISGVDIVTWDVDAEARDLSLLFHIRVMDRCGLILIKQQANVFKRVGLSDFASSQNADNFFALSTTTVIEII